MGLFSQKGEYRMIVKEFKFLEEQYGFEKYIEQKNGSYCFAGWKNSIIKIKVYYDVTDNAPISIITCDADSLGTFYDNTTYWDELICPFPKSRDKIHYAAEWLKKAIENKTILIE